MKQNRSYFLKDLKSIIKTIIEEELILESYSIFPTNEDDIENLLSSWTPEKKENVQFVLSYINEKYPEIKDPIALDINSNIIKITRKLAGSLDLSDLKNSMKTNGLKMQIIFGEGSRGNRGSNNRGNLFEGQWAGELVNWYNGYEVKPEFEDSIFDFVSKYDITIEDELVVSEEGAKNTRRPLQFTADGYVVLKNVHSNNDFDFDVGPVITDVTVTLNNSPIYLSMKLGNTVTFFNSGIKRLFPTNSIQSNSIDSQESKILLDILGLNKQLFCDVFNGVPIPSNLQKDYNSPYDKQKLQTLLKSGIGYNYEIIHKIGNSIKNETMYKQEMEHNTEIKNYVVFYGGKGGNGKRIDMEIETANYIFKLNIRDTQGKGGYPSHIMCEFNYKK